MSADLGLGCVLRVGVTGMRQLDLGRVPDLPAQVTGLLRRIAALATRGQSAPPRLKIISPLAEGADRLVADLALAEGFELVCPLPFAQAEYERDFADAGSLQQFRALLARAGDRVLALDGGRGDDEARSYEAVGRLIARNCDLMLGVWDGHAAQGRGGTAEIVHYAASFGPPVVWLHAADPAAAPRWIAEPHDLRHGAKHHAVEPLLEAYLARLFDPPAPLPHSGSAGLLHEAGHWLHRVGDAALARARGRPATSPLVRFLNERPRPAWGPWRLHGWLMRTLACGRPAPWSRSRAPADEAAARWFGHYAPADGRAGECAARYRSSYVMVFFLAALALIAAAVAPVGTEYVRRVIAATGVELAALALILGLVLADGMLGWQRRAIEYRLLAELCRKQQALAPLAWVVPRAAAWASTMPAAHEQDPTRDDPAAWVPWLFGAWLREAPLPTGTFDAPRVAAARAAAVRDLIDDQIAYHKAREDQYNRASGRLVLFGEILFVVVLGVVAVKLWRLGNGDMSDGWLHFLVLAGAGLPALSAAFVGIRAYAELELLAEQSLGMLRLLHRARAQIEELDPAAPLASQAVGGALAAVASAMLEDLQGWAMLVRAKVVEG